jgi:NADP-dependent aldehyde dehydrogenase
MQDLNSIMVQSAEAFKKYRKFSGKQKAIFLRAIAEEIEALGIDLIHTAMQESNLPEGRLIGERGRTIFQLKMFADFLDEGSWVEVRIDSANLNRQPIPKVDLRKMLVPIGTVVVFGASNFPFAYSTAGGDTASALASGCPVVVKGHPAHARTSAMVAEAILRAAERTGMPKGVFAHSDGRWKGVSDAPQHKSRGFHGFVWWWKSPFRYGKSTPRTHPCFFGNGKC